MYSKFPGFHRGNVTQLEQYQTIKHDSISKTLISFSEKVNKKQFCKNDRS